MGLPTPNLFTGGQKYHSRREWASVQDMATAAAMVVELVKVWGEGPIDVEPTPEASWNAGCRLQDP